MSNFEILGNEMAFHPGYYVKEYVDYLGITQEEFAKRLGTTPKNVSCLINGEQNLSVDMAWKLARYMGVSVKYWLNLQMNYDLKILKYREMEELEKEKQIFKEISYKYFIDNFNFTNISKNINEKIEKLREFLNVSSLAILEEKIKETKFRTPSTNMNKGNIIKTNILLQIATNEVVNAKNTFKYDRKKFIKTIDDLLSLTIKKGNFIEIIKEQLKECGVHLVIIENMSGSKVSGATKKIGNQMLIMITSRYLTFDSFWFTLLHEVGHILDSNYGVSLDDELIANEFARDKLIKPSDYDKFIKANQFDEESIIAFSDKIKRDPSIVVGRLQKDGYIDYKNKEINDLRQKLYLK